MDQCSKAWAGAMRSFGQQMLQLESLLRDHGSDAGPREELLRLLACGSLGAAMHQFLSTSMGKCCPSLPSIPHPTHTVQLLRRQVRDDGGPYD